MLYRVTHTYLRTGTKFINTVAAEDTTEAIALRNHALGIRESAIEDYAIGVELVPDPDGRQEARWIEIDQLRRYADLSRF